MIQQIQQNVVIERSAVVLLARILDQSGQPIRPQDVAAVTCRVWDRETATETTTPDLQALAVADVLSDTLRTDPRWTTDGIGYNLALPLSGENFPHGGTYRVEALVLPQIGFFFFVVWDLQAEAILSA